MVRAAALDETERDELARDQVAHRVGGQSLPRGGSHPGADLLGAPAAVDAALGDRAMIRYGSRGSWMTCPSLRPTRNRRLA
jgi:hypothetical protein